MGVGPSLLAIVYHLLQSDVRYVELGRDYLDKLNSQRLTRCLVRRLERLGHTVTLAPAA